MLDRFATLEPWIRGVALLVAALVAGWLVHRILWAAISRFSRRTDSIVDDSLVKHCRRPTGWIVPVVFLHVLHPVLAAELGPNTAVVLQNVLKILLPVSVAWALVGLTRVAQDVIADRYDLSAADNLEARAIHTQFRIIKRIVTFAVAVLALGVILMSFDNLRQLGTGLLASAGLAGLVVGLAAQRTLANLLAGIQIALTQPMRLDDVVIIEGEWGRIEEITLTYVVVRIWDQRRLVVPISYFIEKPFQNWTRVSADILGTVFLYLDYTVPVAEIRAELQRIVEASENWDRRVCGVQVTNTSPEGVEVRALVSAADASKAWDLRCHVREKLVDFVRERYPDALPRMRAELHRHEAAQTES